MAFRYASIGTIQNCMEHEVFCCGHAWGCRPGDQRTSKDVSVHGPQSPHGLWTGRGHWWPPLRVGNHGRVIIYGVDKDKLVGGIETQAKFSCFFNSHWPSSAHKSPIIPLLFFLSFFIFLLTSTAVTLFKFLKPRRFLRTHVSRLLSKLQGTAQSLHRLLLSNRSSIQYTNVWIAHAPVPVRRWGGLIRISKLFLAHGRALAQRLWRVPWRSRRMRSTIGLISRGGFKRRALRCVTELDGNLSLSDRVM